MMININFFDKSKYTKKIHYYWFMPLFCVFIAIWFIIAFIIAIAYMPVLLAKEICIKLRRK